MAVKLGAFKSRRPPDSGTVKDTPQILEMAGDGLESVVLTQRVTAKSVGPAAYTT